jgi:hypothetical protein
MSAITCTQVGHATLHGDRNTVYRVLVVFSPVDDGFHPYKLCKAFILRNGYKPELVKRELCLCPEFRKTLAIQARRAMDNGEDVHDDDDCGYCEYFGEAACGLSRALVRA